MSVRPLTTFMGRCYLAPATNLRIVQVYLGTVNIIKLVQFILKKTAILLSSLI